MTARNDPDRMEYSRPAHITLLVRRLAAEHAVPLDRIVGTGRGGRIRKQDVLAELNQSDRPRPGQGVHTDASSRSLDQVRGGDELNSSDLQRHAAALTRGQVTSFVEADVTDLAELAHGGRTFPLVVAAVIEVLRADRQVTTTLTDHGTVAGSGGAIHLGIVVDTEGGTATPVIRDADRLTTPELVERIEDLTRKDGANALGEEEFSQPTFTVADLGSRGVLLETPVVPPHQVAMFTFGTVVRRPMVVRDVSDNEVIAIRSMAHVALTYDHRSIEGADAARFLKRILGAFGDRGIAGDRPAA